MKMHRILAEAATGIIKSVFKEHQVLDHALADAFEQNPKWGKRDRSFIAETAYEVVRWRRALGFLVDSEETNAMCAAQWVRMGFEIPEWWNYKGLDREGILSREADLLMQPRAIRESIPDWLDLLGIDELGQAWETEISALNRRAPVYLRANTLKGSSWKTMNWLHENQVEASPVDGLPDGFVLPMGKMLPKPLRMDGRVEIQDGGSQLIAPLLEALPGEKVIDACSGAGGKALHLAALMRNEGRVFAMDVDGHKLEELERRARRAGASCVSARLITDTTADDFMHVGDRLLIDAPCSGLGTLRRQPDLKWRLKLAQLDRVRDLQKDLLLEYTKMLKPGGRLVYATCSILPSENRAAVDFLISQGGFSLFDEETISPSVSGFDGFYAAALVKSL